MTDHFPDVKQMVHSLAPSPDLVYRLRDNAPYGNLDGGSKRELHLIDAAYRAGADQELDACCEWIYKLMDRGLEWSMDLRASRRPKPLSLKELALAKLPEQPENMASHLKLTPGDVYTIRRALEQLDD